MKILVGNGYLESGESLEGVVLSSRYVRRDLTELESLPRSSSSEGVRNVAVEYFEGSSCAD